MKTIIAVTMLLATSISFAAPRCPSGTTRELTCTSAPQQGDDNVVFENVKSVLICSGQGDSRAMVITNLDGESEARAAVVTARVGATSYVADQGVVVTLTKGVGPRSRSTLTIEIPYAHGRAPVSTFACK